MMHLWKKLLGEMYLLLSILNIVCLLFILFLVGGFLFLSKSSKPPVYSTATPAPSYEFKLYRLYNATTGTHWTLLSIDSSIIGANGYHIEGNNFGGYHLESPISYLLSTQAKDNSRNALYGCRNGEDHFLSLQANCEGKAPDYPGYRQPIGYLFKSGPPAKALYRCSWFPGGKSDHFVTNHPYCENIDAAGTVPYTRELLGYSP